MRLTTLLLLIVLLIAVGGHACGGTSTTNEDPKKMTNQDRQDIQTILDRYEKALNDSDVDAVIELYADDGIFMPSSAPTAVGIESVRASYEHVFTMIKLNIAFTVEEIVADGSIAFARTGSKGTVTVLADGTTAPEENRELFVFQKEDGVWKIARYMFNKTS